MAKAIPDPELSGAFLSYCGWTGGDGAYSVPLSKTKSLWLFGDTFIGRIRKGVRTRMDMVHNSAAWLDWKQSGGPRSARFFYKQNGGEPASLVEPPASKKSYYWPGAMVLCGGKLALFCKVVVDKPGDDSGFGFDWIGQDLVMVDNPQDEPTKWRYQAMSLPGGEAGIMPGSACMIDQEYAYVYGNLKEETSHPCVLMRITCSDLARGDISKFEYWTQKTAPDGQLLPEGVWSKLPLYPMRLFNGAPEMSVSRVPGLPGFCAVYTENGLSANILLRHAAKPEGPWSEPLTVYQAPEAVRNPKLFCYGAKHHPELPADPRTLVITYCLNPGPLAAHRTEPFLYFPRSIIVTLRPLQ